MNYNYWIAAIVIIDNHTIPRICMFNDYYVFN